MTALLPARDDRPGRDRLEILAALISAPSFDPLFRAEIIAIPPGHPVYRWNCLVAGCERPKMGHGDLCSAHLELWREARRNGELKAGFLHAARPAGQAAWTCERPCRICPQRPARHVALVLCDKHQFRWFRHREHHGDDADFTAWLAGQEPYPGYGCCRVRVCPELANSPLGLCAGHERRYQTAGQARGGGLAVASGPTATSAAGSRCRSSTAMRQRSGGGARRLIRCSAPRRSTCAGCIRCCALRSSGACTPAPRQRTPAGNCRGCRCWRTTAASSAFAR